MSARYLRILARRRQSPLQTVSPDDFECRQEETVPPATMVEDPDLSLYCLDFARQNVIFVKTPPGVDLSQAVFFYQAQYEAAQRLLAVPFALLHEVADSFAIDDARLILVYSVGRCGSTLVSRAFNEADRTVSFSEPDVYTQLVARRRPDGESDAELSQLVRTYTKVLCKGAARRYSASTWALKSGASEWKSATFSTSSFPSLKSCSSTAMLKPGQTP